MGLSKIEAVNIILESIGEAPVSSLTSGLPDAEAAESKLNEINKSVQARGWHQNIDYNLKLMPNNNSLIYVPSNYLRVDTTRDSQYINVTVRNYNSRLALYDIKKQTYIFTKALFVDVVYLIQFEDLSLELSTYIAYLAARKFQESQMQSVALDNFTRRGEMEAYAALLDAESETDDANILTDSPYVAYATYRHHGLYGR
tara:strand:+ start:650 stop:1249 length:600 start_codon:yes stop_codon:yes gene_type:complete